MSNSLTGVELGKLKRSVGMILYACFTGKRVIIELNREQIAVGRLAFLDECNNCVLESDSGKSVQLFLPVKKSANCIAFNRVDLETIYIKGNKIRYIQLEDSNSSSDEIELELGKSLVRMERAKDGGKRRDIHVFGYSGNHHLNNKKRKID